MKDTKEKYERVVKRLEQFAKENGVDLELDLYQDNHPTEPERADTFIISYIEEDSDIDIELFVNIREDVGEEYIFQTCLENGQRWSKNIKLKRAFYC